MSRWFRHYAGMMRDEKLVGVSLRAKQPVERVVWIWGAILESAAEINDDGRYELDTAEIAYFLRSDESDVVSITTCLEGAGRISENRVVKWADRQFQSDRSAARQKDYRERQKAKRDGRGDGNRNYGDGQVTSPSRHGDAPELELELDTETERKEPEAIASGRKSTRGTRLHDDWLPSEGDLAFADTLLDKSSIQSQIDRFKDHWRAANGPPAVKRDWSAAWRNWCRKAAEFRGRGNPNGPRSQDARSTSAAAGRLLERVRSFDVPIGRKN